MVSVVSTKRLDNNFKEMLKELDIFLKGLKSCTQVQGSMSFLGKSWEKRRPSSLTWGHLWAPEQTKWKKGKWEKIKWTILTPIVRNVDTQAWMVEMHHRYFSEWCLRAFIKKGNTQISSTLRSSNSSPKNLLHRNQRVSS